MWKQSNPKKIPDSFMGKIKSLMKLTLEPKMLFPFCSSAGIPHFPGNLTVLLYVKKATFMSSSIARNQKKNWNIGYE